MELQPTVEVLMQSTTARTQPASYLQLAAHICSYPKAFLTGPLIPPLPMLA